MKIKTVSMKWVVVIIILLAVSIVLLRSLPSKGKMENIIIDLYIKIVCEK